MSMNWHILHYILVLHLDNNKKLNEITYIKLLIRLVFLFRLMDLLQTLYLIFDYPYKYYTFKHFEV